MSSRPVVIEVRDVRKSFRTADGQGFQALDGVSFDVHAGEFFGIVGRNGSGKSTLLKVLSSIYRADAGTVRMAGRLAPFIELGVGFDPELSARENVALNGVLVGLGRREAAARLDAVLDFAELRDYVDMKLKNYSSGMLVRLAFSAMVEADADIMLVDEVLAVGDASFAQKCLDVFRAKRAAGRTVVLVTHDMATVQSFCDRATLIHDGTQRYLGDPDEAARRYLRLNFGAGEDEAAPAAACRLIDAWLQDPAGQRTEAVVQEEPLELHLVVEALQELIAPSFAFDVVGMDGIAVCGFGREWDRRHHEDDPDRAPHVPAGTRLRLVARVENPLVPGRFAINLTVVRDRTTSDVALRVAPLITYEVVPDDGVRVTIEEHEVGMVRARVTVGASHEAAA